MDSGDSEKTPPKGTPKPVEAWSGILPDVPPTIRRPMLPQASAGRPSQPPPVPETAKRVSSPPPRAPPPIPEKIDGEEHAETTSPSIRTVEYGKVALLQILKAFYPDEARRLELNGNGKPVLQMHLQQARDDNMMRIEAETRHFFLIRSKWVALAATAIAIAAGGIAIHSCMENKKLEQRIEQLETKGKDEQIKKAKPASAQEKEKPKPTSSYIPKALSNPPQIQNRIPQRIARNSLRA